MAAEMTSSNKKNTSQDTFVFSIRTDKLLYCWHEIILLYLFKKCKINAKTTKNYLKIDLGLKITISPVVAKYYRAFQPFS